MEYFKKSSQSVDHLLGNNSEPPLPAANETIKDARLEKTDTDTITPDPLKKEESDTKQENGTNATEESNQ